MAVNEPVIDNRFAEKSAINATRKGSRPDPQKQKLCAADQEWLAGKAGAGNPGVP
jgi:hypothetical protein